MKTLRGIVVALLAAVMLVACGGGSPESVAESYVKAYIDVDFKKAAKFATKEHADDILKGAEMFDSKELKDVIKERKNELKGIKYKITEVDIDEEYEEATVRFEFTLNGEVEDGRVELVKEDGKWKVEYERLYL